jgi:putative aldouronate transport system permease protein
MKRNDTLFQIIGHTVAGLVGLMCLIPFLMIIAASITKESSIYEYGFRLIPKEISLEAYRTIFASPDEILNAYKISIIVTVLGTLLSLYIVAMSAYVLTRRQFRYRNFFALMFYFTSIFSAGLIPEYILVAKYLGLKNNILALILPPLLNAFYIILMRNFFMGVPESLHESARIDGADDFKIFNRIYLPVSTAGLATVGLFIGLFYWNNWALTMMFIEKRNLFSLQYYLYDALNKTKAMEFAAQETNIPLRDMPKHSMKMAIAVIATGPIIFLYPFVQKYFVTGLTIGAVKG